MLLMVAFYGLLYFTINRNGLSISDVQLKFAAFLPIASLILTYLAFRAIRKDDALINSLDRLR